MSALQKVASVPATNTASERDFAQLDMLMRSKPSASTIAYESIIMWSNNKTSTWLASLSPEDHQSILDDARKNAPAMQSQIKLKHYIQVSWNTSEKGKKKKEKQEEKAHTTKVKLTQKLTEVGDLWVSEQQLTDFKTEKSEKMYKVALIAQISFSFRKSVLNTKGPKELFQQ